MSAAVVAVNESIEMKTFTLSIIQKGIENDYKDINMETESFKSWPKIYNLIKDAAINHSKKVILNGCFEEINLDVLIKIFENISENPINPIICFDNGIDTSDAFEICEFFDFPIGFIKSKKSVDNHSIEDINCVTSEYINNYLIDEKNEDTFFTGYKFAFSFDEFFGKNGNCAVNVCSPLKLKRLFLLFTREDFNPNVANKNEFIARFFAGLMVSFGHQPYHADDHVYTNIERCEYFANMSPEIFEIAITNLEAIGCIRLLLTFEKFVPLNDDLWNIYINEVKRVLKNRDLIDTIPGPNRQPVPLGIHFETDYTMTPAYNHTFIRAQTEAIGQHLGKYCNELRHMIEIIKIYESHVCKLDYKPDEMYTTFGIYYQYEKRAREEEAEMKRKEKLESQRQYQPRRGYNPNRRYQPGPRYNRYPEQNEYEEQETHREVRRYRNTGNPEPTRFRHTETQEYENPEPRRFRHTGTQARSFFPSVERRHE